MSLIKEGCVIPAHPLALDAARRLDERRQRALTRYYLDAGAGGVAVGVHTTQFEIHDPAVGLYRPVLALAAHVVSERSEPALKVAGVVGRTDQAVREAGIARDLGYDAALLSLAALKDATNEALVAHARAVADVMPVFGFYLQPKVGGRLLDERFWEAFLSIENIVAVKIAPFDRYLTLDVVRALLRVGREKEIALYTGNDDTIIPDLLTRFELGDGGPATIVGGLLGQWAFWTRPAVEYFRRCREASSSGDDCRELLALGAQVTDVNQAVFDPANGFAGCLPGIHEILRRQGLLAGRWCLDPDEELSPGQMERIDTVCRAYPHLSDDAFVKEHIDRWMA